MRGLTSVLRAVVSTVALAGGLAIGCSKPVSSPIQIQRNLITVDNRTRHDWLDVEIWINRQYRIAVPRIAARSRFNTTLDVFVAGFGQRFDRRRQRVDDLRLKAREPDGTPVEIRYETPKSGVAGALEGFGT
jgi:hypothetical protein